MTRRRVAVGGKTSSMEGICEYIYILNKQSRTVDKGWSSSLESGEVLTTPHPKH